MLLPELLLLGLAVSLADSYDRSVNYWEAFAPGKLLQRLDALTVTDVDQSKVVRLPQLMQPVLAANQAQAKADENVDVDVDVEADAEAAVDDDVDSLSAETSHEGYSGEDYERNYEQFVKEYFDRAADDDDHDDGDGLEEEETQAEATSVRNQRCRQVKRKDGQLCEICRQLKNNEVSETCSYSHDDQPQQYAYGSGTEYKRYRDDSARKADQEQAEPVAPSSLCVRRQQKNSVCYECKDSKGQTIERCYDVQARKAKTRKKKASSTRPSTSAHKRKPRSQQSQQSEQEQRIYKRTISYSYAQGTDQQGEQPPGGTTDLPVPRQRRRRLVKITRRRGPAKVQ
ncbi:uncharacterized protein LOC6525206 [Drosophila yakuba]|uniref:Uncharacterized protein n=1 Tax=Drosophila yakuba TaxID=7245 RepID=B4PZJ6_DROYA|nr:uncharacterized protein LOC6525206 [Drosophila yakuba]EDX02152.1 uncharacterized protein Dyak_GE17400 [Drosophila yakuba]